MTVVVAVVVVVVVVDRVVVVVLQTYPFVLPVHVPTRYALFPHSMLSHGLQLGFVFVNKVVPLMHIFQPERVTL